MSTQSYYKDRLGFDPHEDVYDGAPIKVNGNGTPQRGSLNNSHYTQHNISNHSSSYSTPSKKSKHNFSATSTPGSKDGYEDALTQFKGTMSCWEHFVENWDIIGMSNMCVN